MVTQGGGIRLAQLLLENIENIIYAVFWRLLGQVYAIWLSLQNRATVHVGYLIFS